MVVVVVVVAAADEDAASLGRPKELRIFVSFSLGPFFFLYDLSAVVSIKSTYRTAVDIGRGRV